MRRVGFWLLVLVGVLVAARSASSDEGFLPGHSHYGAVFDRSPRQRAYLMGGTGNIHFPVTSKNRLVQKFIEQGIGQLYGFWFVEAERSFREAARLDPNCGIAYGGMSLANEMLNPLRAKQFASEAAKHKAGLTEREQMYIDAIAQQNGYRALIAKYPNDLEAKAFEVWRVWHKYEKGKALQPEMDAAMNLLRDILRVDAMHPIHHAVIHIVDEGGHHEEGLDSAEECGDSAPSIGHMWHMPAHIYFALGRYPEAAWQLEASMRTEHARMMHDRVLPDQVHLYAHNNEWLVRTLAYLGRVHDARRIATQMIDLPRHPLFNLLEPSESDAQQEDKEKKQEDKEKKQEDKEKKKERLKEIQGSSAYYGRERLMQVLRRFEYWDDLIDVCRSGYIEPTRLPAEQGKVHANVGIACYSRGDVAGGDNELAAIRQLLDEQRALRKAAANEKSRGPERERRGAIEKRFGRPLADLKSKIAQLESYRRIATGFFLNRTWLVLYLALLIAAEVAVFRLLRRRIVLAVISAVAAVPVGVWLVYCHLALANLPFDATDVDFQIITRKQLDAGDFADAEWAARNFAKERPSQVCPQANLVEVLYKAGKQDEARGEFETLRELAGAADLDSPPLVRLAPIAREFGFPTDWRRPETINQGLASRRPLPSLGPLLWRPWSAPDWKLKDAEGKVHALTEFHGKPVLMIFFLGNGCLHCKQQLDAFAKKAGQFSEAGLTVIAVSTDDQRAIKKSLDAYGTRKFPFLLLADPELKVFQSYRTYDQFEQIALHGTFTIDREGFVRWHDVGAEPFMDVEFVLSESIRLLSRPVAPVEPLARVIAGTD